MKNDEAIKHCGPAQALSRNWEKAAKRRTKKSRRQKAKKLLRENNDA